MQDSSTNPYIPQENQTIRKQTETLHSPLKRVVKILMIVTLILAILIGVGLFFVIPRTSVADSEARVDFANALQPPGQLSKLVPVKSSLGFSLKYDNQMFTSYAETVPPVDKDGKTGSSAYYENDDLRTPRDYNLVRITPSESTDSDRSTVTDPPQLVVDSPLDVDELKANEAKPDYKGLSQLSLFVQLSTEKRLAEKTADDNTIVSIEATKPANRTINEIKYQHVRYTTKNENYRIVNYKYDDCYYTIQNDTPIAACNTNVRPNSVDDAALNEQMLQSLSYHKPVTGAVDDEEVNSDAEISESASTSSKEAVATEVEDPQPLALETPKPLYNTDFLSLASIAKSQPSVVRIGTLYCADINLKLASGDISTTLTDACVGNLASGTIVSKDGYIATTGHAIRNDPKDAIHGYIGFADNQKDMLDRLDRVLNYLLKARLILDSDAEYLRTGAQIGDQEALAKIENIGSVIPDDYVTPTKDSYMYAIQPTDKPLVLDASTGARPVFAYSDSVIKAKFVTASYEASMSAQESFDSPTPPRDVGLLKAEGSFQNVSVGVGDEMKSNDVVSILGYPSYSDSSLVIGRHQNAPIVTSTKVNQTYEKDSQKLIQINTPVVPGTDGGGTFNQKAELIGFGVYGLSYCPDRQCFANGTVRSSNELTSLLSSENMYLGSLSEATKVWHEGVDAYMNGNYALASTNFSKAGSQYAYNKFAEPLQKLAASKKGSASDTSLMNQLVSVMIGALIVMIVLTVIFAILYILQRRRLSALRVGHYGADVPQAPVAQQPAVPTYNNAPAQQYSSPQQPPLSPPQSLGQQPYYQQQVPPQYPQPIAQPLSPQQPQQPQPQAYAPEQQTPSYAPEASLPQQQSSVQPTVPVQPVRSVPPQPRSEDPFYRQ